MNINRFYSSFLKTANHRIIENPKCFRANWVWKLNYFFFFFFFSSLFLVDFIFKAVLGEQQNWAESTEISHIPPPPHSLLLTCPTRVINLLHLVNLHWSIIAQGPWFTLAFTLGVVCSLCFDKCIMIYMCVCVCVYTHTIVISYRIVLHTEHVVLCCAELSHSAVSDSLRPHGL